MRDMNFLLASDAYKQTHWMQYPPGTERVFSYLESRGGQFDHTIFFGLQYFLKKYLCGQIVEEWMLQEAVDNNLEVFGNPKMTNFNGFNQILQQHAGRWPLRIRAVPEG